MWIFAQQNGGGSSDVAEAMTDVHGSIWLLLAIGAIYIAARFLAASMKTAVMIGAFVCVLVLMNGPGLSGSGVEERWNDVKAKAEAFWKGEDVPFERAG